MTMTDLEILMLDYCTKEEAEKHLKNGTQVFEAADFENNFKLYFDIDENDENDEEIIKRFEAMFSGGKPANDFGVVEAEGKKWYIAYVL